MTDPSALLPTRYGEFTLTVIAVGDGFEHIVLSKGTPSDGCLVRVHSECATGDIFGSLRCDCREQLERSLELIQKEGCGLFLYMRGHEGRGIGLTNKVRAYALQEKGLDTFEANVRLGFAPDERDYSDAVAILRHFGLSRIRLITNNPDKVDALSRGGIAVTERVPVWMKTNPHNERYIATKRSRMESKKPA
ncbi:MAG: GTP cyclohydrolase II [Alphaproteobacteria bacterium]|nr:GTP cyclohydrolase II [Alphaproteobacteria bacterium]